MPQTIDPEWAWNEWQPTSQSPWTPQKAAHLFRRGGLGATADQLQVAAQQSPQKLVDELIDSSQEPESFQSQMKSLKTASLAGGNPKQLSAWWTYRMLSTPAPLLEKMTLFWHGHFATSAAKVEDADLMADQNALLRQHALGDFRLLLLEISRDPAMLIYLDSASNRKAHPNENYAREIMELFCLGEGHYTEQDIRELARCFTGWEVRRKKFRFNRYQHDTLTKTILGRTGTFGGEDAVRIVADQDSAPVFIAKKLVHYFVMDEPALDDSLVAPLAAQLKADSFHIEGTVRRILTSNLFYSEHGMARKIRGPVDFAVGLLRCLDGSTNTVELAGRLTELGQGLFYPPSVKGWDAGRTWINSSTLLGRSNLVRDLLKSEKTRFGSVRLNDYLNRLNVSSADDLCDHFQKLLFAVPIPSAARERIRKLTGPATQPDRWVAPIQALCTLPEFQLC